MLRLRRQLPAHSPIRFGSLVAGASGALGLGRPWQRLTRRLAAHYGASDVLLTDSGTSALRLAIRSALDTTGSAHGDVVALPAYCCPDVATAAIGAGARVRLYDVNPRTLGPDWSSLESAAQPGIAAVVAVHLYGIPVDMERLAALADAHDVLVIEDAAQGFGGTSRGRPLGSLGSLGVLSFGRGKGITGGGGGALLANDDIGRRCLAGPGDRLSSGGFGWTELGKLAAQWLFGRPSVYGVPAALPWLGLGETRYVEPWMPRGMSRGAAAAVLANWEVSLESARARRENARRLIDLLGRSATVPESTAREPVTGALRKAIVVDAGDLRDELPRSVRAAGIERGYPALQSLPALTERLVDACEYPGAAYLARRLFTLPTHELSDPRETGRVVLSWENDGI